MRPIEYKTDLNFQQALRCVEYRLPREGCLGHAGRTHVLALRYGLMGAAACHHLLLSSCDEEEPALIDSITCWPSTVEEHFRWEVMPRMESDAGPMLPTVLANQAYRPIVSYLDGYRQLRPLEECLRVAACQYLEENADEVKAGWGWFRQGKPLKEFRVLSDESIRYALLFFERRQAGLEEVPEIALLGE